MDENINPENRPANPRRRQRSQIEIIKEAYLPAIIAGVALLLIIIFIIGSITRGIQRNELEEQAKLEASSSLAEEQARLAQEATQLGAEAELFAKQYDYDRAINLLDSFSGNLADYPELSQKRTEYAQAKETLVLWSDPGQIPNLSFQILIADGSRAFTDNVYGTSYNRNFVTTDEFSKILQQLYDNDYILVSMSDISSGTTQKELYLPAGKKPIMLTQTQVNYYTYMTDSNGDKLPDKGGDGFASRLVLDNNEKLTCEMVDSSGQSVTGAFDLVPILEEFIASHPDFSYKGARAILAVTGYDGLFGYRTNKQAEEFFGADSYNKQQLDVSKIIAALRETGYELACYTYDNVAYGAYNADQIKADLDKWQSEVAPLMDTVDILVYARNSDISSSKSPYDSDKFNLLQNYGFTHYLGFSTDGKPWFTASDTHIRQGRLMVSGSNMAYHADWFSGIFDASSVLDSARGNIPN